MNRFLSKIWKNRFLEDTWQRGSSSRSRPSSCFSVSCTIAKDPEVLESVTEVSDIDAIIEQAEEDERLFAIHHDSATPVPINLDTGSSSSGITANEWKEQRKREEALHASSLQVPRRPHWTPKMNVEQLVTNEKHSSS